MATKATSTNKLITPVFRGSYCNLVTPRAIEEGKEPEYSITVVIKKGDKKGEDFLVKLKALIATAALAKFGEPMPPSKLKHYPIKDGDWSEDDQFHGYWTINLHNKRKPGAIDKDGNKLEFADDLYSGAWYVASLSAWGWNHKTGGKGVSLNLLNVMKMKDDQEFTGRAKPEEDFADMIGKDVDVSSTGEDDLLK